jgi:hypothetical protein
MIKKDLIAATWQAHAQERLFQKKSKLGVVFARICFLIREGMLII